MDTALAANLSRPKPRTPETWVFRDREGDTGLGAMAVACERFSKRSANLVLDREIYQACEIKTTGLGPPLPRCIGSIHVASVINSVGH